MTCQSWDYGASQVCPRISSLNSTWGIGHIFLDRTWNRP
ncbi:unnamed protein product [Gulo gulo]|uniref:Uncharacterized protein n=1 Tax=Gulo gulo TaxID=48420 RepID=A0A9X9LXX2_GULGU|nr:unnamed protein product [Gulo gulo]